MEKPEIIANLEGAWGTQQNCVLVVSPGHPDYEGEKLRALCFALIKAFRRVQLILDDMTCADDLSQSAARAEDWLERNRETVDDAGISLETMERWSTLAGGHFFMEAESAIKDIYKNDKDARDFLTALAAKEIDIGTAGVPEMNAALSRIFMRAAGLTRMSGAPVVTSYVLSGDRNILDRAKNETRYPNAVLLPEFIRAVFDEKQPEPLLLPPPPPRKAEVIPFPAPEEPK